MNQTDPATVHLERGEMIAWLDGELDPTAAIALERHVAACSECYAKLREVAGMGESLSAALRSVDAAPRPMPAEAVRRRALGGRIARGLGAAAVLLLVFVAGVLALTRDSPVRRWLSHRAVPVPGHPLVIRLAVPSPDSVDVVVGQRTDSLEIQVVRSQGERLEVSTRVGGTLRRLEFGPARLGLEPGPVRFLRIVAPDRSRVRILAESGAPLIPFGGEVPAREPQGDSVFTFRLPPSSP
jgi:hypothetical protein